jgi:hypothetical protein
LVGDQEFDLASFVGSAEPDVVEFARVAQADLAVGVDPVVPDAEVCDGLAGRWLGLDPGAVGLEWCAPVEGSVGADVVVVVDERVELGLELCEVFCGCLLGEVALQCLV